MATHGGGRAVLPPLLNAAVVTTPFFPNVYVATPSTSFKAGALGGFDLLLSLRRHAIEEPLGITSLKTGCVKQDISGETKPILKNRGPTQNLKYLTTTK